MMIRRTKNDIKTRQGFLLPVLIIYMVVASIFLVTAYSMVYTNSKIAVDQYDITQTHYRVISGVEVAYGALFADSGDLFDNYKSAAELCVSNNLEPSMGELTDNIYVDGKEVNITMKLIRKGVHQSLDNYYIHIDSISKLSDGSEYKVISDISVYDPALVWTKHE